MWSDEHMLNNSSLHADSVHMAHAGFHSCNGLSVNSDREKWGTPHLWQDVLNEHDARPLHAVVGGGDQVYNDAVWKSSALTAWLESSNNEVGCITCQHAWLPACPTSLA